MALQLCDGIAFLRGLPDQSIDGIFTDPPWGGGPAIPGQERWLELIRDMDTECLRILRPQARVLIWTGVTQIGPVIKTVTHLNYRWMLLCHTIPMKWIAGLRCEVQSIMVFMLPGGRLPGNSPGVEKKHQIFTMISRGGPDTNHPCARPFHIVSQILAQWFAPGERIVDPFAGSNTTGVAARELEIQCESCEIDPGLYQTGIDRGKSRMFT